MKPNGIVGRRQRLGARGRRVRPVGLPVRPGRGGPGARQPIERDVVEDVVTGQIPGGLALDEGAHDLVVGVRVVVGHPGREGDRRVEQAVADRLRARGHLDEVAVSGPTEGGELLGRGPLLVGVRRHGAAQSRHEQVRVDADQPVGSLAAHRVGDAGADVAALSHVAGVAESAHQLGPGACRPAEIPADLGRLAGEAVPGQGGQHEMKGILGAAAVRGRVRQGPDGVDQLDHGTGPAVGHDQRQRVLVRRTHMDEVDVDAVDLGRELRQRVQLGLGFAPVVVVRPVARERLHGGELDALRAVVDELLARPAHGGDAPTQVVEVVLGNVDLERADLGGGIDGARHGRPPVGGVGWRFT